MQLQKTSLNLVFVYIQGSPPLCQAVFPNKPHTHIHKHKHTHTHTHTHTRTHTPGFPIVGGHGGDAHPHLMIFFENPPTKTDALPLKNEPLPSEKETPLPLKHETSFHEMIPRKNTINNILESS